MIIQINANTALQVNLFHKENCLAEIDCDACYKIDIKSHNKGAKQLLNILGDHYTALFLQSLIKEANKKLIENDKKYKTKHSFIIKNK